MRPHKSRAHIPSSPAQKRKYLPTSPSRNVPLLSPLAALRMNESRNVRKGQQPAVPSLTKRSQRPSDVRPSPVSPVSPESNSVSTTAISTVLTGHSQKNRPKTISQQAKARWVTGTEEVTTLPLADRRRRSSIPPIRPSQGLVGLTLPETGPDPYFKRSLDGNASESRSRSQARHTNTNGQEGTDIFAHIRGQSTPNRVRRSSRGSFSSESASAANDAGTTKRTQPKAAKGRSPWSTDGPISPSSNHVYQKQLLPGRDPAEDAQQGKELGSSCPIL